MIRSIKVLAFGVLSSMSLVACGDTPIADKVHLVLDPEQQIARLEVEMGDGLEVSINGEFPIADGYGRLIFVPATREQNAQIWVEVDLEAVISNQFGEYGLISTLPNGANLPVAILPPLIAIPVSQSSSFDLTAGLSIAPEFQLAGIIGIKQFSSNYVPMGIAVCQNFRNAENIAFAAVCLYGPGNNTSGGIFIGANFGDILNLDSEPQQQQNRLMMSQSAVFSAPTQLADAVNVRSAKWESSVHDPRNDLRGSKGAKTYRNVMKVLRKR